MKQLIFHIASLFWPARCPLCGEITQQRARACGSCMAETERITQRCTGCGCPRDRCMCSAKSFSLNLASPFIYSGAVRSGLHRFKFKGETAAAGFFAAEMTNAVKTEFAEVHFDIVACVPQTNRRRRERGYNQSALLAKKCAKLLGTQHDCGLLSKTRDTPAQHTLQSKARLENVKGVFALTQGRNVRGKTVLLCDDIKTTGATLNECKRVLEKADAGCVYCAVVAVTAKDLLKRE